MLFESTTVHPYGSFWLDVADKTIKALAIALGGIWTYTNHKRARTHERKVEADVAAEMFSKGDNWYLLTTCRLKNVGLSLYKIRQKGTYLSLTALTPEGREDQLGAIVFKKHKRIEPGEQIQEPIVLRIPNPETFVALQLDLRVVSKSVEWNASTIIRHDARHNSAAPQGLPG